MLAVLDNRFLSRPVPRPIVMATLSGLEQRQGGVH
jgi:hypothetical protein